MGLSVTRETQSEMKRIRAYEVCIGGLLFLAIVLYPPYSRAQEVLSDQVNIVSSRGEIYGITPGEGLARVLLGAGETIDTMESKGVTGFVLTNKRLLGFSRRLQRWVEVNLSSAERIINWNVTARLIVVRGKKSLYGFQSDLGRWKQESWGTGEVFQEGKVGMNIGVWVTDRRALGFSAFTGGFFSRDLPSAGQVPSIHINDNIAVLQYSERQLVFRSGLAIWRELP